MVTDKPEEVQISSSSTLPIPVRSRARSDTDVMAGMKLQTIYSVSPPCKQATLLPPSTSLEPPRLVFISVFIYFG